MKNNKSRIVAASIVVAILSMSFFGSHPTTTNSGYTGAPGTPPDNVCTACHSAQSGIIEGTLDLQGLPTEAVPNQTYPLTISIMRTAGSPVRAGFQMVAIKDNFAQAGSIDVPASENNAIIKVRNAKDYVGHQPAKSFGAADVITYDVEWTAPASADGDLTFYLVSILGNDSGGNSGDKFLIEQFSTQLESTGDPLSGTFTNVLDASCSDSNDGSATFNATGGTGNYTYMWDNGESNAIAVMLSAGTHEVTVSDDGGSQIIEMVTIGAPSPLIVNTISQSDATCNGTSTGTAELQANGGTPNYTYNWGNGITGPIQNNLPADVYVVTITDINNCETQTSITISEPPLLTINIDNVQQPSCPGDSDGSITVIAQGGVEPYTYNWIDGIGTPTDNVLIDIPTGTYTVEVLDGNSCLTSSQITVGSPSQIEIDLLLTDVSCFGGADGSALAVASGGTGIVTYSWSSGTTGPEVMDLSSGDYMVTATDENGCSATLSFTVSQPLAELSAGIIVNTEPNCGNADGEISSFADGGTPNYNFEWSTGDLGPVLTNISSGIYSVTATDANGCTAEAMVTLNDADGITLAANNVMNNTCAGDTMGTATISAAGGTGVYTYSWSNGATGATQTNLSAGFYTITGTDESGCTGMISIEITEPDIIMANPEISNISCFGAGDGEISLNPTGGTGELTVSWSIGSTELALDGLFPGLYMVTIMDEAGCSQEFSYEIAEPEEIVIVNSDTQNPLCPGDESGEISIEASGGTGTYTYLWSTEDTTSSISNLSAGDYALTLSDSDGCTEIFEFTLDDPIPPTVDVLFNDPTCNGGIDGAIYVTVSGGTGPFQFDWDNGEIGDTLENLGSGVYELSVLDGNNCEAIFTVVLTDPDPIEANIMVSDESESGASDGSVSVNPSNGVLPYSFIWNTGDSTSMISDLSPGEYSVTITDSLGCSIMASALVNSGDCNLEIITEIDDISCFGLEDGQIALTVSGGADPIEYLWSDGKTTNINGDLVEGAYSVTVTDGNGCIAVLQDISINEPTEIQASNVMILNESAPGANDGAITLDIEGGTGVLDIILTDTMGTVINANILSLPGGAYLFVVTDANGCQKTFGPYEVMTLTSNQNLWTQQILLYPNPASKTLYIDSEKSDLQVSIFNTFGKVVSRQKLDSSKSINIEDIENGLYLVLLSSGDEMIIQKIHIQND